MLALAALSAALAQTTPRDRLNASPRHQEWATVNNVARAVRLFVVYPEVKQKAPAVLVIHENMGLTDWVKGVADQLAAKGYIAVAPDLLSGMAPEGGGTDGFAGPSTARDAIYKLPPEQVTGDLNAAADYAKSLPAASGVLYVAGFCWGGSQSFRFAASRGDLAAAFVFYGTGPESPDAVRRIKAPVYGFYGGNDARVNATIPKTQELMKAAVKTYDPVVYEGAGHGFMRAGEDPGASPENRKAREEGWSRWLRLMKQ
ncbi:MAG: dienelactone hydrolase family protein [Bryobacteraceae bacterium]